MSSTVSGPWLFFLFNLPGTRASERVKFWRRLKNFGAVQLKTSAYVLPDEPVHYERFQWLGKEIVDVGGEATLARVAELEGMPYAAGKRLQPTDSRGKVWLTRIRPEIDRVGSAWLIRRFIDPEAKFVFGDEAAHPEAIPYDMLDVEFSHHGDHCTFETLIDRFGIRDRAAQRLAELIHDADLEDDKFHRIEGFGVERVFKGRAKKGLTDQEILSQGFECFEGLYAEFKRS
jgi:hypothetical protein